MIKTLIILVLLVLLCGGAYLSRPGWEDFKAYYNDKWQKSNPSVIDRFTSDVRPDAFLDQRNFKDRYLFTTFHRKDGSTAFVGVFGNFWEVGKKTVESSPPAEVKQTSFGS